MLYPNFPLLKASIYLTQKVSLLRKASVLRTRAIRFLSKGFRIAASNPAPRDRTRKDWLIHVLFGSPKEMLLRPEIVLTSGKHLLISFKVSMKRRPFLVLEESGSTRGSK